eukprot:3164342-Pyramimonas_sp.AAC.1
MRFVPDPRCASYSGDPGHSPRIAQDHRNWNSDGRLNDRCSAGSCVTYFWIYCSTMANSSWKIHGVLTSGQNLH